MSNNGSTTAAARRHVWITGGGSGIGRALALHMAREGWRVAISGRSEDKLRETRDLAGAGSGEIGIYPCDVTDPDGMHKTVRVIESQMGPIGIAVLNAGIYDPTQAKDFSVDFFRETMETNFMGVVHGINAVLPGFEKRKAGHIVVVASVAGYRGLPLNAAYGASKAALINMAEGLKFDLEPKGIRVSVVNPGFVKTPLTDRNKFPMPFIMEPEAAAKKMYAGILSGRFETTFPRALAVPLKIMRCLPYALYFPLARKGTSAGR